MLQAEVRRQVFARRLYAKPLGGMVAGGDKGHAAFLRKMKTLLGYLPLI
jgi:hypothetical protein